MRRRVMTAEAEETGQKRSNEAFLEEAAETAAKLHSALVDADKEAIAQARATSRAVVFESANAPKRYDPSPGVAYIVETIFIAGDEVKPTYRLLGEELAASDRRVEHAYLLQALDKVDSLGFLARRLYATVRHERDVWERRNEVRFAAIRHEAVRKLQEEKDRKERSKQITDRDVDTECALMAPDEWQALETERSQMKHMEEAILGYVEAWASRARSLQTMFGKSR